MMMLKAAAYSQFTANRPLHSNLSAADSIVEEIYEVIQRLVPFPGQGHARPDLTSRPLRFQILRDYVIEYAPAEEPLLVIAAMLRARE